jgi:hypothetical protein
MAHDLNQECDMHADRAACPDAMIAEVRGGFGLYVRDGEDAYAASTIEIAYCPWCGTKLPLIADSDLSAQPEVDAYYPEGQMSLLAEAGCALRNGLGLRSTAP